MRYKYLDLPNYVYVFEINFIWFIKNSIIITEDLFNDIEPLINWRLTAYFEILSVIHRYGRFNSILSDCVADNYRGHSNLRVSQYRAGRQYCFYWIRKLSVLSIPSIILMKENYCKKKQARKVFLRHLLGSTCFYLAHIFFIFPKVILKEVLLNIIVLEENKKSTNLINVFYVLGVYFFGFCKKGFYNSYISV